MTRPEPWLRGPLPEFSSLLMPAAHALMQAREDIETHVARLSVAQVWAEPGGAPSVGLFAPHRRQH